MGILDSNRVFNTPKEKRGVVSVDLTKQGVQGGNISVEGVSKFIIKVAFSTNDSPSIKIMGGAGESGWTNIDIYTIDGVKSNSYNITSDGVYIVDVSNLRGIMFVNNTALNSGTATIEYTGKTSWTSIDELKMWEKNILPTYDESEDTGQEIFDLSTKQTLKTKTNTKLRYGAMVINVMSISEGASITVVHNYKNQLILNNLGEVCYEISKIGVYYIPCTGIANLTIYNDVAVSGGSVKFYSNFTKAIPRYLESLKPNQILSSFKLTLSSDKKAYDRTIFTSSTANLLPYFKFLAVNVQSFTSTDGAKNHTFNVGFNPIKDKGLAAGSTKVVLEVSNAYRGQSEWVENNAVKNMYVTVNFETTPATGDYLNVEVVGIR